MPVDAARRSFVVGADAVCETANRELAAIPPPTGPKDLPATLEQQLAVQQHLLDGLRRIEPARADRALVALDVVGPLERSLAAQRKLLPQVGATVASHDDVALAALHQQFDQVSHPPVVATFVHDFGLRTCESFEYFRQH